MGGTVGGTVVVESSPQRGDGTGMGLIVVLMSILVVYNGAIVSFFHENSRYDSNGSGRCEVRCVGKIGFANEVETDPV